MVVNCLDKEFPKKFKNKCYKLEELITENMKVKSYNFKCDIDFDMFIVFLNFGFFSINIKFRSKDFIYLKIDDIYNKITRQVEEYLLKYIYK